MVDAPRSQPSVPPDPRDPGYERVLALLEQASEGSRELDAAVADQVYGARKTQDTPFGESIPMWQVGGTLFEIAPRFTTSLDAALTLVPEGWQAILYTETNCAELYDATLKPRAGIKSRAEAATLPLSICVAAIRLRGRQAKREGV